MHGFGGYQSGRPLPTLPQILAGESPADSSVIRPVKPPGTAYQYSGGGYCVVQQMMIDASGKPFPETIDELVLAPLKMKSSTCTQPLTVAFLERAAARHDKASKVIPGKRNVNPEMAAGLWTTASSLNSLARFWDK